MATVADINKAVELYYSRLQLDGRDISELFGGVSRPVVCQLRKKARLVMAERGLPLWDSRHVETRAAYEAWGLDIADLEARRKKLKSLGFAKEVAT